MAGKSGPDIVKTGLVLYLDAANKLSYPGSGTAWKDLSGNSNTGTLTNGPTFSTSNLGTIVFDGVNDYVNISDSATLNASTQTISVWYKPTSLPGRAASLVNKHAGLNSANGYNLFDSGAIDIKVSTTTYSISPSTTVVINNWYNLVLTYTVNTTMSGYINGKLQNTIALGNLSISSNSVRIGLSPDSFWSVFTGNVGCLTIYNRELSSTEVLQNYNAVKSRFGY
jgi:hypothetical protein